jgi:hypothetical protein
LATTPEMELVMIAGSLKLIFWVSGVGCRVSGANFPRHCLLLA